MPTLRQCADCGIKMPAFRRRNRMEDGRLVCDGCHPDKPGSPSRPIGHHGSFRCEACATPMGPAGLVRTAGILRCADGCPTRKQAWIEETHGEAWTHEVEGVGEAVVSMEVDGNPLNHTGRWQYDAFRYDDLPVREEGVADSLEEAKRICEQYIDGGQMTLVSRRTATDHPIFQCKAEDPTTTCEFSTNDPHKWLDHLDAVHNGVRYPYGKAASFTVIAHDSGDGKTVYHCPFCGAGQTVARSDGTVECGFCHTYFTVQVQPEHSSMPQTDPLTGQPLNMPGMPGNPAEHSQPNPTPTQTNAPAGTGDFAPAGTGGPDGFAPAGQGPMEQFAPAGSNAKAARKTAADEPFQQAVRKGLMMGMSEYINPGAMLPSSVYVVLQPGPNGARPTDRKTTDRDEANRWAAELLAQYPHGFPPPSRGAAKTAGPKENQPRTCPECRGLGQKNKERCSLCHGRGEVSAATYHEWDRETYGDHEASRRVVATSAVGAASIKFFLTGDAALPESSYIRHLALKHADNRAAVLQQVRNERAVR